MDFNSLLAYLTSLSHVFSPDIWALIDTYFKTILVFSHFGLATFALFSILQSDYVFLKNYNVALTEEHIDILEKIKHSTSWSLFWLCATGAMIVMYGVIRDPLFLTNQKLWVKIIVVCILTVNGFFVHWFSDRLRPTYTIAYLSGNMSNILCTLGAISSTSWVWACFLGVARLWNKGMSFELISFYYFASLIVAISVAQIFHAVVVHFSLQAMKHAQPIPHLNKP
jgi:hypothetical protein